MIGIDHDVVQHAGWSPQRHVVVPLNARVGIAEHFAVPIGDKDDDVRVTELRPEKRAVRFLGPRRRRNEALRIEVVMKTDKESAESADGLEIRRRCRADVDAGAQRSTIDICFSL